MFFRKAEYNCNVCSILQISSNEPVNGLTDFPIDDSAHVIDEEEGTCDDSKFNLFVSSWFPSFVLLYKPSLMPLFRRIITLSLLY